MGRFSEKKYKDVFRTIATAKLELSVVLVISFQPLTNFTKSPDIGAIGVLNTFLEYYIKHLEIFAGDQVKANHLAYKCRGGTRVEFLLIVSKICFHRSMILTRDFY